MGASAAPGAPAHASAAPPSCRSSLSSCCGGNARGFGERTLEQLHPRHGWRHVNVATLLCIHAQKCGTPLLPSLSWGLFIKGPSPAIPVGPHKFPGISIGVDRSLGTVGEVLKPPAIAFEMVPGVPWRFAGKSPVPGWPMPRSFFPTAFCNASHFRTTEFREDAMDTFRARPDPGRPGSGTAGPGPGPGPARSRPVRVRQRTQTAAAPVSSSYRTAESSPRAYFQPRRYENAGNV
eukprot:358072-Chlamydomonas_euryale.AAC.2